MVTRTEEPIGPDAPAEERSAKHRDRAQGLLDHAEELLKKSPLSATDRLQVSEKIWGSVSHTLKAIGTQRGWESRKARALDSMNAYLAKQSGDRRIVDLYLAAQALHVNFYEDRRTKDFLERGVGIARELNARMWAASESIPPGASPPHGLTPIERGGSSSSD